MIIQGGQYNNVFTTQSIRCLRNIRRLMENILIIDRLSLSTRIKDSSLKLDRLSVCNDMNKTS